MKIKQVMEEALLMMRGAVLDSQNTEGFVEEYQDAATALRKAIEGYDKQEPVAWTSIRKLELLDKGEASGVYPTKQPEHNVPLYTNPQKC